MANERARELRSNATTAERRLWHRLRALKGAGWKFRRQVPIDHFIVDFACLSHRIIIEVDGATHVTDVEIANDAYRQKYLENQGFTVLRYQNIDVRKSIDGVMDAITGTLHGFAGQAAPTPDPSPQGGGEGRAVHIK